MNEKLKNLYFQYISLMNTNKKYYPFLIRCPNEYENAKIKIMFVGNDIKNFAKKVSDFSIINSIEYSNNNYNSVKQFAELVNEKVNGEYIVTELFPLCEYNGDRKDFIESDKWLKDNYNILINEIKICNPNYIVFLTQDEFSLDTFLLKGLLESNVIFMPFKECVDITLIKNSKILSENILLRVPKPGKNISNKTQKIIDILSSIIKNGIKI